MDEENKTKCLYMGNISYKATKADLRDLVKKFGEVENIKLFQRSGYCFITFTDEQDAANCLKKLNGSTFLNRELKVAQSKYGFKRHASKRKCVENTRVYVGNIAYSCDEDAIRENFSKYGEIVSIELVSRKNNSKGAQSRGFAFINFKTFEQAQKAIKEGHRTELCGRLIKVSGAHEKVDYKKQREEIAAYQEIWYWHLYNMYQWYKESTQPAAGIYPPLREMGGDKRVPSFGLKQVSFSPRVVRKGKTVF